MDHASRLNALCQAVAPKGDAILLTKRENIRYYSGYTGEGSLLVLPGSSIIITDFRYTEQAERQSPFSQVRMTAAGVKLSDVLREELSDHAAKTLLAEDDNITRRAWVDLSCKLADIELIGAGNLPEGPRRVKSDDEIEIMARAEAIVDAAFDFLLGWVKPGLAEIEIAWELEYRMRSLGAEGCAFDAIVASGPNGSLPHAEPGPRILRRGDMVTFDFGAKLGGLCSDFTRTIALGDPGEELRGIYGVVLEAQLRGLDALKAGARCAGADFAARSCIEKAGYGARFGHSLGHGVGMMIHEAPGLSAKSVDILAVGHVVTVEPGIYIPGLGGVRIEDMCVITEDGYRNLAGSTKQLVIL